MRILHTCLAAIALLAMSGTSEAALLLHSFEDTTDGYELVNATSMSADTGVFATEGTYSLKIEGHGNGWSQPVKNANLSPADLENHDTLSYDYHVPGFVGWMNLGIRIAADGWGGPSPTETVFADSGTISWNYKDDAGAGYLPGATWAVFVLEAINAAGSDSEMSPMYIDNVRLSNAIPEPSSCLLALGLVGLGWLGTRRRNR